MHLFDYDSGLSVFLRKTAGTVMLGLLWIACCIPVFPAGAASAALYYSVEKHIIREEDNLFSCYWNAFRDVFKTATLCWLVYLCIILFLGWDLYFFLRIFLLGNPEGVLGIGILALLLPAIFSAVYCFSYLARFSDGAFAAMKNAVLLMLTHPLLNLQILFIGALGLGVLLTVPAAFLLLPGFGCWGLARSMEPLFCNLNQKDAPAQTKQK